MNKKLLLILLATVLVVSSSLVLVSCGEEVSIDHLEIYSMPKTEYLLGESLDIKDAKLMVVYKNNTKELVDITSSMLSGFNPNVIGEQYIKVYYGNHSTVFTVNVTRTNVTSVELIVPDENVNYIEGQLLRTNGTYMQINFSDGDVKRIDVTREMCSGYDATKLGSQTVTVVGFLEGVEYTSSFVVSVTERELIGIEVTTAPTKQIYYIGDSALDLTGGELFLKYNSGYSEYISMTDINGKPIDGLEVSWDNTVVNNRATVKVTYGFVETSFQIQVKIRDVASYEIEANSVKAQKENVNLDLTGMQITINYNNGESELVTLPSDKVAIEGFDPAKTGSQLVSIAFSYGGVALATKGEMVLLVEPRELMGLEMVNTPVIYEDTEFDVSDFTLKVVYDNGEYGDAFNLTENMIAWENNIPRTIYSEAGNQSWFIVYDGAKRLELTYEFVVEELKVDRNPDGSYKIELHNADNVIAYLGGDVNTTGVTMTITYNSGLVKENVALESSMVSGYDKQKIGLQLATITFEGVTVDLYVNVVKQISSVEVKGDYRTVYIEGEEFDTTGMELEVYYVGEGTPKTIKVPSMNEEGYEEFYSEWSFYTDSSDGLTFTKAGEVKVYLSNVGLTEDEEIVITVRNNVISIGPLRKEVDGIISEVNGFGDVIEGMDIDLTGFSIFVDKEGDEAYDDYVTIDKDMIDYNPKHTAKGERAVTIYYKYEIINEETGEVESVIINKNIYFITTVNVIAKDVTGIKLLSAPNRTVYYQDTTNVNGVATEYEGMMLSLEYNNGTFGAIDIEEAISMGRLIIGTVEVETKGTKKISFSYRTAESESYEGSFDVQVVDSTPVSMVWATSKIPYVELAIGTKFDIPQIGFVEGGMMKPLTDLKLNMVYSGSAAAVPVTLGELERDGMLLVEGYNANQNGTQDVRIVHKNDSSLYVSVTVKVVERVLNEINLLVNGEVSESIEVIQGAVLTFDHLSLQLVFMDGSKTVIPMDASYVNVSESNPNGYNVNDATVGARNVTISYVYGNETTAKERVVVFNVKEKTLLKIEINDIPVQFYVEHEEFNKNQGSIMLYYDNGTTEIKRLSEASTSLEDPNASFRIDVSRFNNEEFTGNSKVQLITISLNGRTTNYNVYMQDRRNPVIEYSDFNVYTYTYGDTVGNDDFMIDVSIKGYVNENGSISKDIYDVDSSKYTIEYVPKTIWETLDRAEWEEDYTVVPKDAGEYVIVVRYNTDLENILDMVNNGIEDASKILTIEKKTIYVSFEEQSKIYGEDAIRPVLLMGVEEGRYIDDIDEIFEYGEDFYHASFNPEGYIGLTKVNFGANIIDIFTVIYQDKNTGIAIDLMDTTPADDYNMTISNKFVSPNYDIKYVDVNYKVLRRNVTVTPESITYAYGATAPRIPVTVEKHEEGSTSTTGLYGDDMLIGNLSKSRGNDVGEYSIEFGSLSNANNPNYNIILNVLEGVKVTITRRNIYVKTDSTIKVYGEAFKAPSVKFFVDPACTIEEGAFAYNDTIETLGTLTYPDTINELTNVGNHKYECIITDDGVGRHNYNVISISGYVEVVKRPVNIIASAVSKVYGEADPVLGYDALPIENNIASGLVNGDALEGMLSRDAGENYGEYTIKLGSLGNSNYDLRFTSNKFNILRKQLYVYIAEENLSKIYDGKVPSISSYTLYETLEEDQEAYTSETVRQFISFEFQGESKNFGSYNVSVRVNSNNYSVNLFNESGYSYEILKRKVAITANEYFNVPDGEEYKASPFAFYAQINPSDLQHVYNNDGSYATDDNNKPLFDDPSVILSTSSVTNQGTYTIRVIELADKNYELDVENSQPITFTVLPRKVKIVIKTNAEDNTIEREFNNQSAYISASDYTLENLITERDIPYFNIGIYAGGKITSASDVLYNDEDGSIRSYDIAISENSVDPNYVVELAEAYKYKIVPKPVSIRIYDKYLTKAYDGYAPNITTAMFAPVSAVTGFDTGTVSFEFIRKENDGRDNSSVGDYIIEVSCTDRNFNVTTYQPNYEYEISPANVSVSLTAQSMEKAYDGFDFGFESLDLAFTVYYSNDLIVHNFEYGVDENDLYQKFVDKLATIEESIKELDKEISLVDFTELSYAKEKINKAITNANNLLLVLNSSNNPMQDENNEIIIPLVETIVRTLENVVGAIESNERDRAIALYDSVNGEFMPQLKNAFDKEQSYVAFIFKPEEGKATSAERGTHTFTAIFNDFNRNFTLLNGNKTVRVLTHALYVNVKDIVLTYGEDLGTIPFELFDPRTEEIVKEDNFQIEGNVVAEGGIMVSGNRIKRNVGYYNLDVSGIYISEGGVASDNYSVIAGEVGQLIIKKATLSIRIDDVEDAEKFVYGKTVESSQFSGAYRYIGGSNIPSDSDDPYYIALIAEANAWADANGYGQLEHYEKMRLYYGEVQYDDQFESVIIANAVRYNCYLNGISGAQIFDTPLFDAGKYKLGATGFKADNYEIKVIPGVLTVAKRALNLYTQNGYYEKEYGESKIKYVYTNFAGNENEELIKVYVDSDGDGIAETEVSTLANMAWDYSVATGATDPLDPKTQVSDEWLSFLPTMGNYVMKNYTINFSTQSIIVTKAPLYCTVVPTDETLERVTSIYMDLPTTSDYKFSYSGLKNDDKIEDIITSSPSINFLSNGMYFDAGIHILNKNNLDTTGITLQNYDIMVEEFQYGVERRKVYVSLENLSSALITEGGNVSITPYIAEVVSTKSGDQAAQMQSVKIVSGQYGLTNFVFKIEGSRSDIESVFNNIQISKYTKTTGVFNEKQNEAGTSITHQEYYRYADLYKHNISYSVDLDNGIAKAKLSNMGLNSTNFVFEYEEFEVKLYGSIAGVAAYMEQKLLASDLALSDAEINDLIKFVVITNDAKSKTWTIKQMIGEGLVDVDGNIPNEVSKNALMTYVLKDPSFNYVLTTTLTDAYYTNYYSGVEGATGSLAVEDLRLKVYDYASVGSCTLPLRFYPESTAITTNPTLSDGVEYGKLYSTDSIVKVTAQETLFNAMMVELSVRPNANVKLPSLEIGLNANITDSVISLIFNYGVGNVVTVKVNNSGKVGMATYSVAYGNLFDGNLHEIRAYLDKENLTLVISIDGTSGAMLSLNGIVSESGEVVLASSQDIVESSTLSLTLGGDCVIRSIMLSEQGLYDGIGAHIAIPENVSRVVKVPNGYDVFETTISNLNTMFGIRGMGEGYSIVYYVNGEMVEYNSDATVLILRAGTHLVEMGLYKDGALVDYDYFNLRVEKATAVWYVSNVASSEVITHASGIQLPLYDIYEDYEVQGSEDKNLVDSGIANNYGYKIGAQRQPSSALPFSYFSATFALEPSATYDSDSNTATYKKGQYETYFELFSSTNYGTVDEAWDNSDETYQGAEIVFTRRQTEDVLFGNVNDKYSYDVRLSYYVNGKSANQVIATGLTNTEFEVVVYKDRNSHYYGDNGIIVILRSLDGTIEHKEAFNAGELYADDAGIYPQIFGQGDRVTMYGANFDEVYVGDRDYLLDGQYKGSIEALTLGSGENITLADNAKNALYSMYDNLILDFNVASGSYVDGNKITFNLAGSEVDGRGKGITLEYNLANNSLVFTFYKNGDVSRSQVWGLSGSVEGKHLLRVIFDKELTQAKANNYVGGENARDLTFAGNKVTNNVNNVIVHYTTVMVVMDGAVKEFYVPLYDDLGCWVLSDGGTASDNNQYSEATYPGYTPTFLPAYSYTSVETNVENAVTINKYSVSKGEDNSYLENAITESPRI